MTEPAQPRHVPNAELELRDGPVVRMTPNGRASFILAGIAMLIGIAMDLFARRA